jgi:aspartyl-tRNA(Asn)/glutamyl-tRNA(Gln) amidotransferase subunit C
MIVDDQLVDKLANLSKLDFDAEAKKAIRDDLTRILDFMEKLNEVDTEGVEPLIYINEDVNVFREDEVYYPITKQEALFNAPLKNDDYIKVPKFVKGTKYGS